MAKFYGAVGFVEHDVETRPGVYGDKITEKQYYGETKKTARRLVPGIGVNDNVVLETTISILPDEFGIRNYFAIEYVKWMEVAWKVTNAELQAPRLILTLGDVYHGPSAFVTRNVM